MLTLKNHIMREKIAFFTETDKAKALRLLVDLASADGRVESPDDLYNAVIDREEIYSTGIGFGIAIPHARTSAVKRITLAMGVFGSGMEYGSMDDNPVKIVVLIAVPEFDQDLYIRVLSKVLGFLKKERDRILKCATAGEIADLAAQY